MMRDAIELVKCYEGDLVEEEWLESLLAPLKVVWRRDAAFSQVTPGALYVVSGQVGFDHVPQEFLARVEAAGDCGLCHFSDEFLRGDYGMYASFAYVLRNYHTSWLDAPGVLTIPLGFTPGLERPAVMTPASEREHLWCMIGLRNASRAELVRAWSDVPRGMVHVPDVRAGGVLLPRERYLQVMTQSAFAPAPMGNAVIETWRMWEALEVGTIPVAPRRGMMDYYRNLLGPHPVPTFETWAQAGAFVKRLGADPGALDALQREVLTWWAGEKVRWADRVKAHIEAGETGVFRESLVERFRGFSRRGNQPRRVLELLKHHDQVAIRGRFALAARRIRDRLVKAPPQSTAAHPLHKKPPAP